MPSIVRSSTHSLKYTNIGKLADLEIIRNRYTKLVGLMVDDIWDNGLDFNGNRYHNARFDRSKHQYDLPSSAPKEFYNKFGDFGLSARIRNQASTQALGMIKAAVAKNAKRVWQLRNNHRNGWQARKLQQAIARNDKKPSTKNLKMQLSSKNVDIVDTGGEFEQFVRISALGDFEPICIPIRHHRHSNALRSKYKQSSAILVGADRVQLVYKADVPTKCSGGKVGVDQGVVDTARLSDGQVTGKCIHGHDLSSIQDKLARKKKGSKAFRQAQQHRTNYINYAINRLNLSDYREVRLEKVRSLRKGRASSRKLSHWAYAEIESKFHALSETEGFQLTLVPNAFMSQRCSECGWVKKSNRKGKGFVCTSCGIMLDADENSSQNQLLNLYEIPYRLIVSKLNRTGFYWDEFGIWQADGSSLESLLPQKV